MLFNLSIKSFDSTLLGQKWGTSSTGRMSSRACPLTNGHLAVLDRLGRISLFPTKSTSFPATKRGVDDGAIKVKNIDYIDHESITISYCEAIWKSSSKDERSDFISDGETETLYRLALFQPPFQELIRVRAQFLFVFCLNGAHSQYRIISSILNLFVYNRTIFSAIVW